MEGQTADACEKMVVTMPTQLQFRNEVFSYIRACEHLISAARMPGNAKLTVDECQVVDYYADELSKVTETDVTVTVPPIRTTLSFHSLRLPVRKHL